MLKGQRLRYKIFLMPLIFFLGVSTAFAAIISPTVIPSPALPGRAGQELRSDLFPAPRVSRPRVTEPEQQVFPEADKIHFKLTRVTFEGNTVFTKQELQKIFQPYVNKTISLHELIELVHQVTVKYRTAGYILSRAILPPQKIKNGVVHIKIIEGFVSNVTISGKPGNAKALLEAYGQHILQSRPLKFQVLERYVLLANDLPGMDVQAVINPSKNIPAGADLTLVAQQSRVGGSLSYDNYGTRYEGPNEFLAGASLYSLLTAGQSDAVRFAAATQNQEMEFSEFIHAQPLGTNGMRFLIGGDYTKTRPGFVLEPLEIVGNNGLLFTDVSYPLIRSRSRNVSLHTGFSYQNVTATILGGPFYQDRMRNVVVGGTFDNFDDWRGITTVILNLTQGFDIWGAHDHFNQSRPEGSSTFTKTNAVLSRLQGFGSRYSVLGVISGQYGFSPLLATEQFGVGGPDIGRGYDPSEIIGDQGVSGKLEFRIDTAPGFRFLNSVQYYVFYDAGVVWNLDTLNLPARQDLASIGGGIRFNFVPQLTGNFYIAKPLTRQVSTMVILGENPNQIRSFFQIAANI